LVELPGLLRRIAAVVVPGVAADVPVAVVDVLDVPVVDVLDVPEVLADVAAVPAAPVDALARLALGLLVLGCDRTEAS